MGAPTLTSQDESNAYNFAGQPGIADQYQIADAMNKAYTDPNLLNNQLNLQNALAARQSQMPQTMQAAQLGPMNQANTAVSSATQMNMAPQQQTRDQQQQLGNMLMQSAEGKGPSVAQAQLQQATDQNIAQQQALAASMRGVNPAMAARLAANNSANAQQQAANQSAIIRAQEQQSAQGQLGNVLANTRGQDIGVATDAAQLEQQNKQFNAGQMNQQSQFNAGQLNQGLVTQGQMQQQANANNLQAGIEQQRQLDEMTKYYTSNGLTIEQAQFAARQQMAQQEQNAALDRLRIQAGLNGQAAQADTQMGGAAVGALASLGMGLMAA